MTDLDELALGLFRVAHLGAKELLLADEPRACTEPRRGQGRGGARTAAGQRAGGIRTRLITWMTPFVAITSGVVTFALFTKTFEPATRMRTLALLACVPDEQHDLGLIAFGLALRARGWRIAYLGPDTPLDTLADAAASLGPELVVVTAVSGDRIDAAAEGLRALGARHQVAFGGSGGRPEQLSALGLVELAGDPVAAAERATELVQAPPPAAA